MKEALWVRLRRKSPRNLARIVWQMAWLRIFSLLYSVWLRFLGAEVGRGCLFRGPLEIRGDPARIRIGSHCVFEPWVCLWTHDYGEGHGRIELHDSVLLGRRVTVNSYDRITLGEGCALGDGCYVQDNDHGTMPDVPILAQPSHGAAITFGPDVWLGARCIVLKGVTIGAHTVAGAGSIVVKSLPENVVAVGVPCRPVKLRGGEELKRAA